MEVILLERVAELGQMGEVVRVKDGFARNFLLPRGKALRATEENRTRFEAMKSELQARSLALKSEAAQVADKIDGKSFTVLRQASEAGQLFGSVSPRDLVGLIADGRLQREPQSDRAQYADQDDRPAQGSAVAASGDRDLDHASSLPATTTRRRVSSAARTSRGCAKSRAKKKPRRWRRRPSSSPRRRSRGALAKTPSRPPKSTAPADKS